MKNNIKKIREQKGLSQKQLAELLGISVFHLNRIENGKYDCTIVLAARIAKYLESSLDEIFLN